MIRVVVLTGVSGAGKTTAFHALEDIGFYTVDNLPPSMWPALVEKAELRGHKAIVLGIDIRAQAFLDELLPNLDELERKYRPVAIIYLDASNDVLVQRYGLTRRTHPLREGSLGSDIRAERAALAILRTRATTFIDTSPFSARDLTDALWKQFKSDSEFILRFVSFGFKRGIPLDADNILDVRGLPNPYYDENLKAEPGTSASVQSYVFTPLGLEFYSTLRHVARSLTELARSAGRSSYSIAVGCTGGQHRSVAVAERLRHDLADQFEVQVEHRDLEYALEEHRA
ncbi:MAG: RNase adapter RapZ [Trueperaceae bacterium]|nr:MAG: RNase adapter RapZ [Trueperaceae bacterium]